MELFAGKSHPTAASPSTRFNAIPPAGNQPQSQIVRKLRSDSTFANLPPILKDSVDEMLLSGASYKAVQATLAADGHKASQTSIKEYYHNHILPIKYARNKRTAAVIAKMDAGELDAAMNLAVKQLAYESTTEAGGNPAVAKMYVELLLKMQAADHSERKLRMLEEQRDEAKRIAQEALTGAKSKGGLTSETIEAIEERLKLL